MVDKLDRLDHPQIYPANIVTTGAMKQVAVTTVENKADLRDHPQISQIIMVMRDVTTSSAGSISRDMEN